MYNRLPKRKSLLVLVTLVVSFSVFQDTFAIKISSNKVGLALTGLAVAVVGQLSNKPRKIRPLTPGTAYKKFVQKAEKGQLLGAAHVAWEAFDDLVIGDLPASDQSVEPEGALVRFEGKDGVVQQPLNLKKGGFTFVSQNGEPIELQLKEEAPARGICGRTFDYIANAGKNLKILVGFIKGVEYLSLIEESK